MAVPFFLAIGFAFSDVTAGDPSFDWAGLRTFQRVFDDPVFWRSLRNTFVFTVVSMVLIVVLGKVLANILVADFRGKWLVRFLVLLPWTTPVALRRSPGCGCSTRSSARSTGCCATSASSTATCTGWAGRTWPWHR